MDGLHNRIGVLSSAQRAWLTYSATLCGEFFQWSQSLPTSIAVKLVRTAQLVAHCKEDLPINLFTATIHIFREDDGASEIDGNKQIASSAFTVLLEAETVKKRRRVIQPYYLPSERSVPDQSNLVVAGPKGNIVGFPRLGILPSPLPPIAAGIADPVNALVFTFFNPGNSCGQVEDKEAVVKDILPGKRKS